MSDSIRLAFKNLKTEKIRMLFSVMIIGTAVFLTLVFSVMQSCTLDMERVRMENNPENRQIRISAFPNTENRNPTINLYTLLNELQASGVLPETASLTLRYDNYISGDGDSEAVSSKSEMAMLGKAITDFRFLGKQIQNPENFLRTICAGFDLFDSANLELAKLRDPSFSLYVCGRAPDPENGACEAVVDHLTAKRFGGDPRNVLGKKLLIQTASGKTEAVIVGVYNYYAYAPRKMTETLEEKEIYDSFEAFQFDMATITSQKVFSHANICAPMYITQPCTEQILKNEFPLPDSQYPAFADFQGRAVLTVKDISQMQAVTEKLDEIHFDTVSDIKTSELSVHRMTFIKNIMLFISIAVMIIGIMNIVNTMFMIINERRHYIGMLKVIGFSSSRIAFIFIAEAILTGLAASGIACAAAYLVKEMFASVLQTNLEESGMYRYITVSLDPALTAAAVGAAIFLIVISVLIPIMKGISRNSTELMMQ